MTTLKIDVQHLELLTPVDAVAQDATQLVRTSIQVIGPLDAYVKLLAMVAQELVCRREVGDAVTHTKSQKHMHTMKLTCRIQLACRHLPASAWMACSNARDTTYCTNGSLVPAWHKLK